MVYNVLPVGRFNFSPVKTRPLRVLDMSHLIKRHKNAYISSDVVVVAIGNAASKFGDVSRERIA